MKRTGLNGYVYKFNVDYIDVNKADYVTDSMPFIRKYFMLKYDIK